MPKECTSGDWPSEILTYVHGVDAENVHLKDALNELLEDEIISDKTKEKIKAYLEKFPDFIKEHEEIKEKKYTLSEIKKALLSYLYKIREIYYTDKPESIEEYQSVEWLEFLKELEK